MEPADSAGLGSAVSEPGSGGGSYDRPFIYVYDLGPEYTEKVLELNPAWYNHQYDVERYMTEVIRTSNAVRTDDPEQATLFLIPFFAARYTLYCFRSWENNMRQAIEEGSRIWEKLITKVRKEHPYFNRTNGKDHFSFGTLDHGRCHSLTFVDPRVETYRGARITTSLPGRTVQVISYNYGAKITDPTVPDIPCYVPNHDIVVPALVANRLPIVPPFETEREIKVLFRFGASQHHGEPLKHHNRNIRKELHEMYKGAGHEGWDFAVGRGVRGVGHAEKGEYETDEEWKKSMYKDAGHEGWDFAEKGEYETDEEWKKSIFCICPPGHSQWTSRPFKALIPGCIPEAFFLSSSMGTTTPGDDELDLLMHPSDVLTIQGHDNPWDDELNFWTTSFRLPPFPPIAFPQPVPHPTPGAHSRVHPSDVFRGHDNPWDDELDYSSALISGCIPVTFFRGHDNPWDDELDYSTVSVNIDPDELHTLKERLDAVPAKKLQRNIERIQEAYRWTGVYNKGAEAMLIKRLRQRGHQLQAVEQRRLRALQ
ncbi:unnamed protein product [Closterium sp. NIES-65]|nr:unnamed protein product [Closterium sp. NIES-65]